MRGAGVRGKGMRGREIQPYFILSKIICPWCYFTTTRDRCFFMKEKLLNKQQGFTVTIIIIVLLFVGNNRGQIN